ncbi:hypothetical protein N5C93_04250 [Pseudomonas nitroreducens]|uniref:hypothetical protein n=1 Tax=Pseudomonas nitroreducens TaxID=46680 RepID=UPI00244BD94A|nr:hypothetical protein [Pseudomonas nitroreducens]MDH1072037.1 hypothetical protein [Pseudomonas nitroreducens]
MKAAITRAFAFVVTGLAVSMAVASAWQRAGAEADRWLLAGLSAVIVLAVHLMPALLGRLSRLVVWPVWCLCFLAALWGHIWFFANASHGAAEGRAASSAQARAVQEQRRTIEAALAENKARAALEIELTEGKRANELRAQLVALSGQEAAAVTADPVVSGLTEITGLPVAALNVWAGVLIAMLLEVLGSLLWLAAVLGPELGDGPAGALEPAERGPGDAELVELLYEALENSEISPTAEDICRRIGGCKSETAARLLRGLEARMARG